MAGDPEQACGQLGQARLSIDRGYPIVYFRAERIDLIYLSFVDCLSE